MLLGVGLVKIALFCCAPIVFQTEMVDDQAEEGDDLARELGHQLLLASSEGDKAQVGRLLHQRAAQTRAEEDEEGRGDKAVIASAHISGKKGSEGFS